MSLSADVAHVRESADPFRVIDGDHEQVERAAGITRIRGRILNTKEWQYQCEDVGRETADSTEWAVRVGNTVRLLEAEAFVGEEVRLVVPWVRRQVRQGTRTQVQLVL